MACIPGKPATFNIPRTEIYKVLTSIPEAASQKDIESAWVNWLRAQEWWRMSGYVLKDSGTDTLAARLHKRANEIRLSRRAFAHNGPKQAKYMSGMYMLTILETEREKMADKLDEVSAELNRMQAELIAKELMAKITSQVMFVTFDKVLTIPET